MASDLLATHRGGQVEVAIDRASDYFGPRGGAQSNLGDRALPAALADITASVLSDPDQPHTYTRLLRVHPLLLRVVALANPTVRELLEMQYQFEESFLVDSTKIGRLLRVSATPLEHAVEATLSRYRSAARPTVAVRDDEASIEGLGHSVDAAQFLLVSCGGIPAGRRATGSVRREPARARSRTQHRSRSQA